MFQEAAHVRSGVEMIERVPIIVTSRQGRLQGHVVVLGGAKLVAPMALPSFVTHHCLTPDNSVRKKTRCKKNSHAPIEIIGCRGVVNIEILFLAIIDLGKMSTRVKENLSISPTNGTPGMTRYVIKEANADLKVPFSKLGQRKTSKLLIPYICFGSKRPVIGFRKSSLTNISFQAVIKLVSRS